MNDNLEKLNNLAFVRDANSLYPLGEERYGNSEDRRMSKHTKTGAFLTPDGGVSFKIYAPDAHTVYITSAGLTAQHNSNIDMLQMEKTGAGMKEYRLPLTKTAEGFFEGKIPPEDLEGYYGSLPFTFVVDGAGMVHPYCRTTWRNERLQNCIEIADPQLQEKFMLRKVPHGAVTYEMFWSDTRGTYSPCLVYTPADYGKVDKKWPVLYLQHGGGENETGWFTLGNVTEIMDNLVADGLAEPCVIVMNNTRFAPVKPADGQDAGTIALGLVADLVFNECMPFIESKYYVRTDKWGRAVAGLSKGSMQSSYLGFSRPDLFGYVGLFSGSIRCRHYWTEYEENPHLKIIRKGNEAIAENYKVIYRGIGAQEFGTRPWHKEDNEYIHEIGMDQLECYHFTLHPTMCHEWGCFRRSLYEFVQLIFKS